MKRCNDDWFMLLIVIPCAILGAVILWIGARDIEQHKQRNTQCIDSMAVFEDSLDAYQSGY